MARTNNGVSRPLSKIMKINFLGIILSLLSITATSADQKLIDKIIVIVNDDIIVQSELENKKKVLKNLLLATAKPIPDEKTLSKQALDQLILRSIQLQLAKKQGIKATTDYVDKMMDALAKQNNVSHKQLLTLIKQQQGDVLAFRKKIAEDYIINQLEQNIIHSRIQINNQDLANEIEKIVRDRNKNSRYHLNHYLINSKVIKGKKLEEEAKRIRAKLLKGELVTDLLSTEEIKIQSSDLGLREPSALPDIFINAIKNLNSGELSRIIPTENGIHLLKIIKKEGVERIIVPETKARHILLKITPLRNNKKTLEEITKIRQRLRSGESFSNLAKALSEDTGSAIKGGDLGWFGPGKMVPAFENMIKQLEVNEISKPFKSQFGWHIVQVQGERENDITNEKIKELAQKRLIEKKVLTNTERWKERIKQEAYIEYK